MLLDRDEGTERETREKEIDEDRRTDTVDRQTETDRQETEKESGRDRQTDCEREKEVYTLSRTLSDDTLKQLHYLTKEQAVTPSKIMGEGGEKIQPNNADKRIAVCCSHIN